MQYKAREVNLFNTQLLMHACHLHFAFKSVCLTNATDQHIIDMK